MKWITRERVKVDRVACPWLIRKFVDAEAEFLFVPGEQVLAEAQRLGATPYDVPGVELGHHGQECSFEAILRKYDLMRNPALVLLGKPGPPLLKIHERKVAKKPESESGNSDAPGPPDTADLWRTRAVGK